MVDKDEALNLALNFIERVNRDGWILDSFEPEMYATLTAIKEALAKNAKENREEVADLREKLAASMQEAEIHKRQVEKHYELDTEYYDFYIKAVKSQLKEKNNA